MTNFMIKRYLTPNRVRFMLVLLITIGWSIHVTVVRAAQVVQLPEEQAADWQKLREKTSELEKTDPAKAIELYREFAAGLGDRLYPYVGVSIFEAITSIYDKSLKDPDSAIKTAQSGYQSYRSVPDGARLLDAWARVLLDAGKPAEAESLLKEHWQDLLRSGAVWGSGGVRSYFVALGKQAKHEQIVAELPEVLLAFPGLIDDGRLLDPLHVSLIALKRVDEALLWSKLRLAVCAFQERRMFPAIKQTIGTLQMKDPAAAEAFVKFQKDPSQPNPLTEIKGQAIAAEVAQAAALQVPLSERHARISLQIATGTPQALRQAMTETLEWFNDSEGSALSVTQICRLLKANDLHSARANAFLRHAKTGAGENPVRAFFSEVGKPGSDAEARRLATVLDVMDIRLKQYQERLAQTLTWPEVDVSGSLVLTKPVVELAK